jgi:hypothetical protein
LKKAFELDDIIKTKEREQRGWVLSHFAIQHTKSLPFSIHSSVLIWNVWNEVEFLGRSNHLALDVWQLLSITWVHSQNTFFFIREFLQIFVGCVLQNWSVIVSEWIWWIYIAKWFFITLSICCAVVSIALVHTPSVISSPLCILIHLYSLYFVFFKKKMNKFDMNKMIFFFSLFDEGVVRGCVLRSSQLVTVCFDRSCSRSGSVPSSSTHFNTIIQSYIHHQLLHKFVTDWIFNTKWRCWCLFLCVICWYVLTPVSSNCDCSITTSYFHINKLMPIAFSFPQRMWFSLIVWSFVSISFHFIYSPFLSHSFIHSFIHSEIHSSIT